MPAVRSCLKPQHLSWEAGRGHILHLLLQSFQRCFFPLLLMILGRPWNSSWTDILGEHACAACKRFWLQSHSAGAACCFHTEAEQVVATMTESSRCAVTEAGALNLKPVVRHWFLEHGCVRADSKHFISILKRTQADFPRSCPPDIQVCRSLWCALKVCRFPIVQVFNKTGGVEMSKEITQPLLWLLNVCLRIHVHRARQIAGWRTTLGPYPLIVASLLIGDRFWLCSPGTKQTLKINRNCIVLLQPWLVQGQRSRARDSMGRSGSDEAWPCVACCRGCTMCHQPLPTASLCFDWSYWNKLQSHQVFVRDLTLERV